MAAPNSPEHPLVLVVLDGVGLRPDAPDNAVTLASAPFLREMLDSGSARPAVQLSIAAHGTAVGLASDADMGNSEVGHNIMGAGRIFPQGAKQVEDALHSGAIWGEAWRSVVDRGRSGHAVHFLGLLSDGNVHSHIDHLHTMLERAAADGARDLVVHVLLDGRDVRDGTAEHYVERLEHTLAALSRQHGAHARIGSGGGRMSTTMDRYDADWPMVQRGYEAHVRGAARPFTSAAAAIAAFRAEQPGISDQYLPSFSVVDSGGAAVGAMHDGDAVVIFNFRGDRVIEIYRALTEVEFTEFARPTLPADLLVTGMTLYDGDRGIPAQFLVVPSRVDRTVSELIAAAGLQQAAVAETQKFGHITYFWNGNRSGKFDEARETYVEISSDRVPFEQAPSMKSAETADALIALMREGRYHFLRANFAAGDMVGHTGDIPASVAAVEAIDAALARIDGDVRVRGGTLVITADHGNCEMLVMRDSQGNVVVDDRGAPVPLKSHTLSPVPLIVLDYSGRRIAASTRDGLGLANLGASLLDLLGVEAPADYAPPAFVAVG